MCSVCCWAAGPSPGLLPCLLCCGTLHPRQVFGCRPRSDPAAGPHPALGCSAGPVENWAPCAVGMVIMCILQVDSMARGPETSAATVCAPLWWWGCTESGWGGVCVTGVLLPSSALPAVLLFLSFSPAEQENLGVWGVDFYLFFISGGGGDGHNCVMVQFVLLPPVEGNEGIA